MLDTILKTFQIGRVGNIGMVYCAGKHGFYSVLNNPTHQLFSFMTYSAKFRHEGTKGIFSTRLFCVPGYYLKLSQNIYATHFLTLSSLSRFNSRFNLSSKCVKGSSLQKNKNRFLSERISFVETFFFLFFYKS